MLVATHVYGPIINTLFKNYVEQTMPSYLLKSSATEIKHTCENNHFWLKIKLAFKLVVKKKSEEEVNHHHCLKKTYKIPFFKSHSHLEPDWHFLIAWQKWTIICIILYLIRLLQMYKIYIFSVICLGKWSLLSLSYLQTCCWANKLSSLHILTPCVLTEQAHLNNKVAFILIY